MRGHRGRVLNHPPDLPSREACSAAKRETWNFTLSFISFLENVILRVKLIYGKGCCHYREEKVFGVRDYEDRHLNHPPDLPSREACSAAKRETCNVPASSIFFS